MAGAAGRLPFIGGPIAFNGTNAGGLCKAIVL